MEDNSSSKDERMAMKAFALTRSKKHRMWVRVLSSKLETCGRSENLMYFAEIPRALLMSYGEVTMFFA